MASAILSFVGWSFLPGLVSGWVQTIYYGIVIRAGDPKPAPGTPRHTLHRRRIQIGVIVLYLLYTIFEADHVMRQEGDFYTLLGVPHEADEKKIKTRLRRLAAQYHPDKISPEAAADLAGTESLFIRLKQAQDTLSDPVRRYAYERFGPDSLTWQHVSGFREYLTHGLMTVQGPLYAGTGLVMTLLGFTSYLQAGKFWRFLAVICLLLLEIHAVTRPYFPPLLTQFLNPIFTMVGHPPVLPFQMLLLARKITFTFFIAVSQVSALCPSAPSSGTKQSVSSHEMQQLTRLEQAAKASDLEATRLLTMELAPFMGDEATTTQLKARVRDWLVNNTIRSDPEVRDAMGRAIERRRAANST